MSRSLLFSLLLTGFLFASCNGGGKQDGGPCQYNAQHFQAEVMAIEPQDDGLVAVKLDFDVSQLALEDQDLGDLWNGGDVDTAFVRRNNVRVGIKYTGTVSEVTEGTCTPVIVSFDHNFRD